MFTCDDGFILNGTETVVCQASGSWSSSPPTCDIVGMLALLTIYDILGRIISFKIMLIMKFYHLYTLIVY